jgi:hypothetical protein
LNNPEVGWNPQSNERVFGSVLMSLRKTWAPPNYGIFFTDRRIIFAKVSGYNYPAGGLIVNEMVRAGEKREIEKSKAEYAQMNPQQMADGKDNVGVFYEDVLNVTVRGKRSLEMNLAFSRVQNLGWEKVGFNTWGVDFPDEAVRSLGDLLRKFLPTKLNVQLESSRLLASFGGS